jgi:hypothetical protein
MQGERMNRREFLVRVLGLGGRGVDTQDVVLHHRLYPLLHPLVVPLACTFTVLSIQILMSAMMYRVSPSPRHLPRCWDFSTPGLSNTLTKWSE